MLAKEFIIGASDVKPTDRGDGRFQYAYRFAKGRAGRKIIYGKTSEKCISKVLDFQAKLLNGYKLSKLRVLAKPKTMETLCKEWFAEYVSKLRPTTAETYAYELTSYVIPYVKELTLDELKYGNVENMLNTMIEKRLSKRVGRGALRRLSQVIDYFIDDEDEDGDGNSTVLRNICKSKKLKRLINEAYKEDEIDNAMDDYGNKLNKEETRALSEDELVELLTLSARYGRRETVAFLLMAITGLRPGEVLGIRIEDVKFDTKTILIRQDVACVGEVNPATLEVTNKRMQRDKVKSYSSMRPIYLTDTMIKILKAHMERIESEKEKGGEAYNDMGYLFPTRRGTIMNIRNFARVFDTILSIKHGGIKKRIKQGIKAKSPHRLRNTFTGILRRDIRIDLVHTGQLLGHSVSSMGSSVVMERTVSNELANETKVTLRYEGKKNDYLRDLYECIIGPHMEKYCKLVITEFHKRDLAGRKRYR